MAEQTLTVAEIKRLMFRFLQQRLPDVWDTVTDDDLVRLCNKVAKDLNQECQLRVERYTKTLTAQITYLEVQRDILHVYWLYQEQDNWKDQRYGILNDNFVFQLPVTAESKLDIIYLGDTLNISNEDTDSIDLPGYALEHFSNLLKDVFIIEFGDSSKVDYDEKLKYYAKNLRKYRPNNPLRAIPKSYEWGYSNNLKYDITDQRLTADYIITDGDDIPYIVQP